MWFVLKSDDLFLLVFVESFARLASELALGDEFVQERRRFEERLIRVLLLPAVNNELGGVQSDVIGELESKRHEYRNIMREIDERSQVSSCLKNSETYGPIGYLL